MTSTKWTRAHGPLASMRSTNQPFTMQIVHLHCQTTNPAKRMTYREKRQSTTGSECVIITLLSAGKKKARRCLSKSDPTSARGNLCGTGTPAGACILEKDARAQARVPAPQNQNDLNARCSLHQDSGSGLTRS